MKKRGEGKGEKGNEERRIWKENCENTMDRTGQEGEKTRVRT